MEKILDILIDEPEYQFLMRGAMAPKSTWQ